MPSALPFVPASLVAFVGLQGQSVVEIINCVSASNFGSLAKFAVHKSEDAKEDTIDEKLAHVGTFIHAGMISVQETCVISTDWQCRDSPPIFTSSSAPIPHCL